LVGEVHYFTRLAVTEGEDLRFADVALILAFCLPNEAILRQSRHVLAISRPSEAILAVKIQDILSIVAMIPFQKQENQFFCMERPGLAVSPLVGENAEDDEDEDNADDVE
jgi:hypothetical protein